MGAEADVAVLRLEQGKFGFVDVKGGRIEGPERLGASIRESQSDKHRRPAGEGTVYQREYHQHADHQCALRKL